MNDVKFRSTKEDALVSLGALLSSYADLQTQYTSRVHMPDFRTFSDTWESSLYLPIRNEITAVLKSRTFVVGDSLLYCAPGPHTPLLRNVGDGGIAVCFDTITLLDIDDEALRSAKQLLSLQDLSAKIDIAALDLSGPFGQRLCETYLAALRSAETAEQVAKHLAPAHSLASSIFSDVEQVLAQLTERFDTITGGRRYNCLLSEMIASFTGTAVWLAFRSALYERFASKAPLEELDACLSAGTLLWQLYNEHFLSFHLDFLRGQTERDGFIVLVFDTCKVYDLAALSSLPALRQDTFVLDALKSRQLQIARQKTLCWRDHPNGFDVNLYGIPVSDFQAHTHDVELYFLEAASS